MIGAPTAVNRVLLNIKQILFFTNSNFFFLRNKKIKEGKKKQHQKQFEK